MDQSTTEDHWIHCELDTPSDLQVLQIDLNGNTLYETY